MEQGKNIEPNKLISHLDDEGISQFICESAFLPQVSEQNKERVVDDCIQRLKKEKLKLKKQQLHEEIKSAQDLKDEERLHRLMREFHHLTKKSE